MPDEVNVTDEDLKLALSNKSVELFAMTTKVNDMQKYVDDAKKKSEDDNVRIAELSEKVRENESLRAENINLQNSYKDANFKITQLETSIAATKKERDRYVTKYYEASDEIDILKLRIGDLERKLRDNGIDPGTSSTGGGWTTPPGEL
ncbi:hypothetical protein [Bacillus pseudomycoides]|uniref:hypothetical protein n=1 Tax=Bacillus pseudomycoides TaxID=64104 RepID=UPI000BF3F622|nr:hypothetical protein [Bacillus pseudomycoides]PEP86100.1 hypothetical protein CN584_08560 [Bacillus pseudomycoides]